MRLFKTLPAFLLLGLLPSLCTAQYQSSEGFDNCNMSFCVDCGDAGKEAEYNGDLNAYFAGKFSGTAVEGLDGEVSVQVLIDTAGVPCIKSVSYNTNRKPGALDLKALVNNMGSWRPAVSDGRLENVSTSIRIDFANGIYAVSNVRQPPFEYEPSSNMWSEGEVTITNKQYKYGNEPASRYIQVFQKANSAIPVDMSRAVAVDKNNVVWYGTDNGMLRIQDGKMTLMDVSNIAPEDTKSGFGVDDIAIDKRGVKWISVNRQLYSYDDKSWQLADTMITGASWVSSLTKDINGNIWVGGKSLEKWDGQAWTRYDSAQYRLPSAWIECGYEDSKGRIWFGTDKGLRAIQNGKAIMPWDNSSPVAQASIMRIREDEKGNLWFVANDDAAKKSGIVSFRADGSWKFYNTLNSGLPGKHISDILIDEDGIGFWAAVEEVGLVHYDGHLWKLLTRKNSKIPSTEIPMLAKDRQGRIWAATSYGLAIITTK